MKTEREKRSHTSKIRSSTTSARRELAEHPPITVDVKVDNCLVNMEVDTCECVSLMSYWTFTNCGLGGAWGQQMLGFRHTLKSLFLSWVVSTLMLEYQGQTGQFPLVVVEGSGPTLMEEIGCL